MQTPSADAGEDQTVAEGCEVSLDGSGSSDPNGDALDYEWIQVAGPAVALDLSDPVCPTFSAPYVQVGGQVLTFILTVSDGINVSDASSVNITVMNVPHPPIADAGDDQTCKENTVVGLDGTNSFDEDGEELIYSWTQILGPAVILDNSHDPAPDFTAPMTGPDGALLSFELAVSDGTFISTDTVTITVENVNQAPRVVVEAALTRDEGMLVALDGAGSEDPDDDALTYSWTQITGLPVDLTNADCAVASFTAPFVIAGGESLAFELSVSDGQLMDVGVVTVFVRNVNDPPNCDLAKALPGRIWPPNHKLVPIKIIGVADPDDDDVIITITGVTQDEPEDGLGDGDTAPDAVIQGDGTVLIRAERDGDGNGRIYVISFSASDEFGQTTTGSIEVCVPHSRKDSTCVDDGQVYDSLIEP
jgi:hypothetical protein